MRPHAARALLTLLAALALVSHARVAAADEARSVTYEVCHAEAYLAPDGNLTVRETWTVELEGVWDEVSWTVEAHGSAADTVAIVGAGEVVGETFVPYGMALDGSHAPGTYRTSGDLHRRMCTILDRKSVV